MISIITVCLNAADDLEKTILSVLAQKDCEIEYIIKDGMSVDHTNEVVAKYEPQLQNLKSFFFVSEKDKGLYDAMNIATQMATGSRVQFLNSGDVLFYDRAIADIEALQSNADIVYGNYIQEQEGRFKEVHTVEPHDIAFLNGISHQAVFIKTDVMKQMGYDVHYPICADCDFFLRAYTQGRTFQHIDKTVISFQLGGISYQRAFALQDEHYDILYKYGRITEKECVRLHRKNHFKRFTRSLLPKRLYEVLKTWKRRQMQKKWSAVDTLHG